MQGNGVRMVIVVEQAATADGRGTGIDGGGDDDAEPVNRARALPVVVVFTVSAEFASRKYTPWSSTHHYNGQGFENLFYRQTARAQ